MPKKTATRKKMEPAKKVPEPEVVKPEVKKEPEVVAAPQPEPEQPKAPVYSKWQLRHNATRR